MHLKYGVFTLNMVFINLLKYLFTVIFFLTLKGFIIDLLSIVKL